jgi:D-serine deaminase-like pyridoxal phosphate-dependent protein
VTIAGPEADLAGEPDATGEPVAALPTPALLLDPDVASRNITQMAEAFGPLPARLRPHVKAHKCAELARLQLESGAAGLTCATVAEVAAFARHSAFQHGATDLLLANQVSSVANLRVLARAAATAAVTLAVESPEQAALASRAATEAGTQLGVLIEVDVGAGRGGLRDLAQLAPLAGAIAGAAGLRLAGLMGYEGHATSEPSRARRRELVDGALAVLRAAAAELRRAGHEPGVVSAGGTGTFDLTGADPLVTEIQAGSYVIMDVFHQETSPQFGVAVTVAATVLGRHGDLIVLDAGRKALGGDLRPPRIAGLPRAEPRFLNEEHSGFAVPGPAPRAGDQVRLVCGYAPTAVNLYPWYHVVRDGIVVGRWPVIGRHGER